MSKKNKKPDSPRKCKKCDGTGVSELKYNETVDCDECQGVGYFGVDPRLPTPFRQGTWQKAAILQIRYFYGIALWNDLDGAEDGVGIVNIKTGRSRCKE